ncbi:hypothetical protein [Halobacteriovorax sp. HLS]|uniref:hypothetical protein n=1 Tax=Halobacteriovorax sp. HLS TaxID=2234000 RepID=UPI0013E29C91|nr:hypothetical protein [Halobacteriovorax sp. HLS]
MLALLDSSEKDNIIEKILKAYMDLATNTPKAVYLSSIAPLILENGLSDEYILKFKSKVKDITMKIVTKIAEILETKDIKKVSSTFLVSYNFFLGSWQHCNPPENVKRVLSQNDLSDLIYDFEKELSTAFRILWKNM